MKYAYNYLLCIIYFVRPVYSMDFHDLLTKNSSIQWILNQTKILNPNNKYCSICCMDMKQLEKGRKCGIHTMCVYETKPIGASCKGLIEMKFSKSEINAIVDVHNTLRNKVAMGMEAKGDPGPQPRAANMRLISWDAELATIASRWAAQCIFSYDKCRDLFKFPVGQNVAKGSYSTKSDLEFIADWYEPVVYVGTDDIRSYRLDQDNDVSHYTQLVWADTFLVGCARVCFQKAVDGQIIYREHFFCNYGPSGNIPGQTVYKIGDPCSGCLDGTGCNNPEYPALCGNELITDMKFKRKTNHSKFLNTKSSANDLTKLLYFHVVMLYCTYLDTHISLLF